MIDTGKLQHHVTLQRKQTTRDPKNGDTLHTWVDHASVWASLEPLSGRDFIAAAAVQSKVDVRMVIYYRDDVTNTLRIKYRGKAYTIHAVLPDKDTGLEYLTLMCSTGVSDG